MEVLPMTTKKSGGKPRSKKQNRYPVEFKLQAVRLFTEENYTADMVASEQGIGKSTLSAWVRRYRESDVAGLEYRAPVPNRHPKISPAVKSKAVELKQQDPKRGSRRISHLLHRFCLMKASPETVRRTLTEQGLIEPPAKKPNPKVACGPVFRGNVSGG
jgi:transposase-like protein